MFYLECRCFILFVFDVLVVVIVICVFLGIIGFLEVFVIFMDDVFCMVMLMVFVFDLSSYKYVKNVW